MEESSVSKIDVRVLLGIAAMGFMWAEFWAVISMGLVGDVAGRSFSGVFCLANAFGQVLFLFGCLNVHSLGDALLSRKIPLALMVALSLGSILCAEFLNSWGVALIGCCGFLLGCCLGCLWLGMARFLSRDYYVDSTLLISMGAILGFLLHMGCVLVSPTIGHVVMLLFTPVSLMLYFLAEKELATPSREEPSHLGAFFLQRKGLLLVVLVFGTVYGTRISASYTLAETVAPLLVGISLSAPALVLLLVRVAGLSINLRVLALPSLALTLVSMLPLPFWPDFMDPLRFLLLNAGFNLFDLSSIATYAEMGKKSQVGTFLPLVTARLITMMAILGGIGLATFFGLSADTVVFANSVEVVLLVAAFYLFGIGRRYHNLEVRVPAKGQGKFKDACDALSLEYKLTPRERELLVLVAKGYNAKRIEEELVISESTVKTHMKHVYAKMGIHTQQGLIKMVEDKAQQLKRTT